MIPIWVNDYVGIPYSDRGRSHESCDCYGLIYLIYKEKFSIELPTFTDQYEKVDMSVEEIYRDEVKNWKEVKEPKLGDVVYFKICGHNTHVGMYLGDGLFIHNISRKGSSSIAEIKNPKWVNRIIGYWTHD